LITLTITQQERKTSAPHADAPEHGVVCLHGVPISRAAHWIEDGDHVLRSMEFDLIVGAPSLEGAVVKFLESAEDIADHLAELGEERVTHDEVETALALFHRFTDAYKAGEAYYRRHIFRLLIRRILGRPDGRGGYHPSSQPSSSQPQLA
jgi:hypothetical protein